MDCPFCKSELIQELEIVRNNFAKAFPTNIPIVPGHLLITPIRHVSKAEDLHKEELEAIFALRNQLSHVLKKIFDVDGFNYAWNEGSSAGQSVFHFHLHMVPRKFGDTGITEYDPRKFLYRPGSRETSPDSELQAITEQIKQELS